VILALVVDDILVIGSDVVGIVKATGYIKTLFVIKDIGRPRYFLEIEIARNKYGIFLSQ